MNTIINDANTANSAEATSPLRAVQLPEDVDQALRRVVDYLWEDEYRDYQSRGRTQRESHICRQLHRLRVWLRFPEARVTPS